MVYFSAFPETPNCASQKLLLISFDILFFTLWAYYNAILYSYFSVQITDKPINTRQQLENARNYKIGASPYDYGAIRDGFPGIESKRFEKYHLESQLIEVFQRMCKEKFAIITMMDPNTFLRDLENVECDYYTVELGGSSFYLSYGINVYTPLEDLFRQR